MLLVIINQTRKGWICPHLLKTLPLKLRHKTCSMLTWATTPTWPMITLRRRGILIILSATIPELFRMFLPKLMSPHQRPCVLTSRYCIRISNHTLHHLQRPGRLTRLTTKFGMPQQASPQPSSMNCLTRPLSPMGGPLKSFGNSQFSTCTTAIHELLGFVQNLAKPMK
jgi:hypothetical protein